MGNTNSDNFYDLASFGYNIKYNISTDYTFSNDESEINLLYGMGKMNYIPSGIIKILNIGYDEQYKINYIKNMYDSILYVDKLNFDLNDYKNIKGNFDYLPYSLDEFNLWGHLKSEYKINKLPPNITSITIINNISFSCLCNLPPFIQSLQLSIIYKSRNQIINIRLLYKNIDYLNIKYIYEYESELSKYNLYLYEIKRKFNPIRHDLNENIQQKLL